MEEETVVAAEAPKKKKGRRSIAETNRIRKEMGLLPVGVQNVTVKKVVKAPGRPKKVPMVTNSEKGRQQQFLAALLHSKGTHIIQKILNKAMDDDDKDQMACMKMCIDRILPQTYFEKAKTGSGGVNITITGITGDTVVTGATIDQEQSSEYDDEEIIEDYHE